MRHVLLQQEARVESIRTEIRRRILSIRKLLLGLPRDVLMLLAVEREDRKAI